jgi:hypothetical protein
MTRRNCHSRPPGFGVTLESQAVECSAKLADVWKGLRLDRGMRMAYREECDCDSICGGNGEDASFNARLVRISAQQQMIEGWE